MTDAVTIDTGAPVAAPAAATTAAPAPLTAAATLAPAPAPSAVDPTAAPDAPAENALALPGTDATPEQWAEFYGKLGRPETPDDYVMEVPDGDDGAFAKQVAPLLHEAGVTAKQAEILSKGWNQMRADALAQIAAAESADATARNTQNTAEAEALKTEWGQQHEANMHHAQQAVKQFLPAEHAADIISAIESKVGYRKTIEMLHAIGKGLGEHDAAGLSSASAGQGKSLAQRMYPNMPN